MKVESIGNKYKRQNKGGSTLEILIAFFIITLAIGAVIMLSFGNQSVAIDSETNNEALSKAEQMLEEARVTSLDDFSAVNPLPVPPLLAISDSIYQKTLEVRAVPGNPYIKEVTSKIKWKVDGGRDQTITLSTLLTDKDGVESGNTCNSVLSGDWTEPQLTSYEFGRDLLVPSDPSSGFPIGDIDVKDKKLYVVVNNSNGNNMPNFFRFDISNPSIAPQFLDSFDNNTGVKVGLNAVHVADHYAYVASANGSDFDTCVQGISCSQLQVIDLNTMTVVGKLKIPGVTGDGNQSVGNSIFYKDGVVYLGLAKTDSGPEFNMIDVGGGGMSGASPSNPIYIKGFSIGHAVNSIFVKDKYAYIVSPHDEELKILNVENPGPIVQVGQFDAPLGGANNGNGKSLYAVGNTLYLGRTLLTGNELYILNKVDSETSLPILGLRDVKDLDGDNTSVNGILVRDYLAFLLTNKDFQVLKIDKTTNPYTITNHATALPTPGGSGTTMDCEENYIYFASLPSNDKGYIAKVTGGP